MNKRATAPNASWCFFFIKFMRQRAGWRRSPCEGTPTMNKSIFSYLFVTALMGSALAACENAVCSGNSCSCPAGDTCALDCEGPSCRQECEIGSDCALTCKDGSCYQNFSASAKGTATCVGGGCQQSCAPTATCTFSCEGGNCTQACLGNANCKASCAGDNCTSDALPFM